MLDPKRSEGLGQLRDATQTVSLEGTNLKVQRTIHFGENEPETFEFVYLANGQLHRIVGPQEFERDVTAEWKGWGGKKLEVKWTFEIMGFSIDAIEIWELKKAGLRLSREFDTPRGKREQKVYFVRPGNKKK